MYNLKLFPPPLFSLGHWDCPANTCDSSVCTHTRPHWGQSVLTASHPMQDSFWISFPALSLKGLHQLLPSPLASTRSR